MEKFLKDIMYRRCKRDHLLLSATMQGLHFRKVH